MHTNGPRPSRATRPPTETYTLGGLLVYAAAVPALIAVLTAPLLVAAFVLGAATAVGTSRLRAEDTGRGNDPESEGGDQQNAAREAPN